MPNPHYICFASAMVLLNSNPMMPASSMKVDIGSAMTPNRPEERIRMEFDKEKRICPRIQPSYKTLISWICLAT